MHTRQLAHLSLKMALWSELHCVVLTVLGVLWSEYFMHHGKEVSTCKTIHKLRFYNKGYLLTSLIHAGYQAGKGCWRGVTLNDLSGAMFSSIQLVILTYSEIPHRILKWKLDRTRPIGHPLLVGKTYIEYQTWGSQGTCMNHDT